MLIKTVSVKDAKVESAQKDEKNEQEKKQEVTFDTVKLMFSLKEGCDQFKAKLQEIFEKGNE